MTATNKYHQWEGEMYRTSSAGGGKKASGSQRHIQKYKQLKTITSF